MKRPFLAWACLAFLPAWGDEEAPLSAPEALAPAGAAWFLRGTGLEALQAHLDAFCNKFPCGFTAGIRLKAGPWLGRPALVAADGTRPWAILSLDPEPRPEALVFLVPVEDPEAFRHALADEGLQVRLVRGYALVGREAALLDGLGGPEAPLPPPVLRDDLVLRLGPGALRALPDRMPEAFGELVRSLPPLAALEAGCSFGEEGMRLSLHAQPEAGGALARLLAAQPLSPPRWLGLAPAGAALAAESRLDPAAAGACLDWMEGRWQGEAAPLLRCLRAAWAGEAFLTLFLEEAGWQAQGLGRPADAGEAKAAAAEAGSGRLPGIDLAWTCDPVAAGSFRLRLEPKGEGKPAEVVLQGAFSQGWILAAAGPGSRLPSIEALPSPEPLPKTLPDRGSLFILASLGRLAGLLGRLDPGLAPEGLPELRVAGCLRCEGGAAELRVAVPGKTLVELSSIRGPALRMAALLFPARPAGIEGN